MKLLKGLAMLAALCAHLTAHAGFTALYVFGDSLSDTGNMRNAVYYATGGTTEVPPSPPYATGRASNGPVAVEYLAGALGLTAQPVILADGSINPTGTNFAFLGSATGPVTQWDGTTWRNYMPFRYNPLLPDVGMDDQVGGFAWLTSGMADPNALYFLWGGANDAYLALEDPGVNQNDQTVVSFVAGGAAVTAANNIYNLILALAGMGAQTFLVPNLPDLGLTPDAVLGTANGTYGSYYAWGLSTYTMIFNSLLAYELVGLDADPAIRIIPFDTAAAFEEIRTSGLYDVTTPCLLNPLCDPDTTVFWDGVHPTTAFHERLGLMMARAVPEPASVALLAAGLLVLMAWRARRGATPSIA